MAEVIVRHLLSNSRFELITGSVLDARLVEATVSKADRVYHLAAAVGVRLIVDKPLQSLLTNIRGTENVLEAAAKNRKRVLLTSTSEIYGKSTNGPFREDDDRLQDARLLLQSRFDLAQFDSESAHTRPSCRGGPSICKSASSPADGFTVLAMVRAGSIEAVDRRDT